MSETILIKYTADTKEVNKALRDIDTQYGNIDESSKKATKTATKGMEDVDKSASKLNLSFQNLGVAIAGAFAVQQIIGFGRAMNDLGIQLETTAKRMEVVFGASAKQVRQDAKNMAESLGLSVSQFELMATKAGDILVPLGVSRKEASKMSTEIVKLAGALAEFSAGTVTTEQAVHAVTSALTGEREMLKTLGVVLKEDDINTRLLQKGQKGLEGQALNTAKAIATLELVSEKSADAQTFFAENADSSARKTAELRARIQTLREELATKLQPVFLKLTKFAVGFLESLDIDRIGRIAKQVVILGTAFKTFRLITTALTGPLGMVVAGIGALASAVGVARIGVVELEQPLSRYEQTMERVNKLNTDATEKINSEVAELAVLFEQLKQTNAGTEERADLIKTINDRYGTTLTNISDETEFTKQLTTAYDELVASITKKIKLDASREILTDLLKEQLQLERSLAIAQTNRNIAQQELDGQIQANGDLSISQLETMNKAIRDGADKDIPKYEQQLANVKTQIQLIKQEFTDLELLTPPDLEPTEDCDAECRKKKYDAWLKQQEKLKREQQKAEKERQQTVINQFKALENNLKNESLLRQTYATDTIKDEKDLKSELLKIEIEHLQKLMFFRRLVGIETYDLALQLSQKLKALRETDTEDTVLDIANVGDILEQTANNASEMVEQMGGETIAIMANVAGAITSLGRSVAGESLELAIFEVLLNKAIAISQIFAKAQTGEVVSTSVKIGLLMAQLLTGFAQINSIISQAQSQKRDNNAPGFARGGIDIGGDGSSTGDGLLVRISPRESIINAESTRQYKPALVAINDGTFDNFVNERYIQPAMAHTQIPIVNVDGLFDDERLLNMQSKINKAESKRHKELLHAINGGSRVMRGRKNWY